MSIIYVLQLFAVQLSQVERQLLFLKKGLLQSFRLENHDLHKYKFLSKFGRLMGMTGPLSSVTLSQKRERNVGLSFERGTPIEHSHGR